MVDSIDDAEDRSPEEEGEEREEEEGEEYCPKPPSLFDNGEESAGEEQLYPGAGISVLTTCTFLWSLCKTAGWRVEHIELLLKFMSTTLLPKGNKMPRSMYRLQKVVGDPRMKECTYRMCPNGCKIWHFRDEKRLNIDPGPDTKCEECGTKLYRMHGGLWVPVSKVYYFGIASMVR